MKIDKRRPRHWWLLLKQGLYALLAAGYRPFSRGNPKPMVVLYGHQFNGNLNALYRGWEATADKAFEMHVLCLDPDNAEQLKQAGVQTLRCDRLRDMLRVGSAAAVLTDHGPHLLIPLIYCSSITFVDVWHGIPFKGFTPKNFSWLHAYDECWVTSALLRKAYTQEFGFDADKVKCLGYARTDQLFQTVPAEDTFRQCHNIPAGKKLVLYAPTWHHELGTNGAGVLQQTQHEFLSTLAKACSDNNALLVVRSHLNAAFVTQLPSDILHCPQKLYPDTESLLLAADVLIADWSSIVFDYLPLQRPAIFLAINPPFRPGTTIGPEYRYGAVVADMNKLLSQLQSALVTPEEFLADYEAAYRTALNDLYDSAVAGKATQIQLDRLSELCRES